MQKRPAGGFYSKHAASRRMKPSVVPSPPAGTGPYDQRRCHSWYTKPAPAATPPRKVFFQVTVAASPSAKWGVHILHIKMMLAYLAYNCIFFAYFCIFSHRRHSHGALHINCIYAEICSFICKICISLYIAYIAFICTPHFADAGPGGREGGREGECVTESPQGRECGRPRQRKRRVPPTRSLLLFRREAVACESSLPPSRCEPRRSVVRPGAAPLGDSDSHGLA